ncbi:hypothetical protein Ancab_035851, partial [Ancistrocladus abbreviatus]
LAPPPTPPQRLTPPALLTPLTSQHLWRAVPSSIFRHRGPLTETPHSSLSLACCRRILCNCCSSFSTALTASHTSSLFRTSNFSFLHSVQPSPHNRYFPWLSDVNDEFYELFWSTSLSLKSLLETCGLSEDLMGRRIHFHSLFSISEEKEM